MTSAVLSKLPLGLLGFFGIKNGGQYPQTLGDVVIPQLDMAGLLAANYNENFVVTSGALPGAAGFVPMTFVVGGLPAVVPNGEVWYLSAVSVGLFTGVGDSFTGTFLVRSKQSGSASAWSRALSPEYATTASLNRMVPGTFNGTQWVGPGDEFGWNSHAVTNASGTAQATAHIRVTRFPF